MDEKCSKEVLNYDFCGNFKNSNLKIHIAASFKMQTHKQNDQFIQSEI